MPTPKYALHLKGYVGGWDFDSDYVDFILSKNSGKEVSVLIDSLGGQLNTALSISSAFRRHGNVHAHFVGMNASAATIASMGAKRITMDASAMYLVHQCSQSFFEWGSLNATDMQHLIDNLSKQKENLDKMDANVATMYASRCKKRPQDLLALMQKGGWLSAEEALAWGFVDELITYDDEDAPVITDAIAADFKAHNIPVPDIPSTNSSVATESKEELTTLRRFFLALSKAFHAEERKDKNLETNSPKPMKKEYKTICQLLQQEATETTDNQSAITASQLDTIETELSARDEMIASLTKKVNDLSEENKSLETKLASLPAASTQSVIDDKKPTNSHTEKSDIEQFIDYNKLKDETLPANGGIRSYFGHHSFNHSMMVLSDMPQTTKGSWFLHYEQKMDTQLIDTIKGTIYKIWQTKERIASLKAAHQSVPAYLPGYLKWLDQSLNRMRSVAVHYKEYSTLENLQLLGEEYIRQMKRDLTPKTFQTSILCQKIGISHDGFYSSMQEYHKYDASDFSYLDSLGYEKIIREAQQDRYSIRSLSNFSSLDTSLDCRTDADIDPLMPLSIGMDYNANINWIVCGQPRGNRLNILKSFYVKFERKIPALIADFCAYYAAHPTHSVIYYYDATALGSNYAVNDQDFHWVVVHEFERQGWTVQDVYLGNPMRHDEKYLLINQGFAGKQRLMPYFNRQNNDDLILAIQSAGVERGRNGFRKNKSMEKQPESEEDLLEHRTDGTDAFDTLYIGCEKFPQHDFYPISVGGVR